LTVQLLGKLAGDGASPRPLAKFLPNWMKLMYFRAKLRGIPVTLTPRNRLTDLLDW
jgi:hypothetical protein